MLGSAIQGVKVSTHRYLKELADTGRVLRIYTQNIDTLHEVSGIDMNLLVRLHGDLEFVKCSSPVCNHKELYSNLVHKSFERNESLCCCRCSIQDEERTYNNKRKRSEIGRMVPNIVLYDDPNDCSGVVVTDSVEEDIKIIPDLLLIFGSSLTLTNLNNLLKHIQKQMVKPFAIYINKMRLKEVHSLYKEAHEALLDKSIDEIVGLCLLLVPLAKKLISSLNNNFRNHKVYTVVPLVVKVGSILLLIPTIILNAEGLNEYGISAKLMVDGVKTCTVGFLAREYLFFRQRYENKLIQIMFEELTLTNV
ncbi:DHS-like NAD/FAD-binding domain-containing protein [Globomyces pollinis-pini]|nr:DHS-like NAD/FAD-binding domain-containing protein [Globomyces pollinis-pini]